MKNTCANILLLFFLLPALVYAQPVSKEKMQEVYDKVKTPFKYGTVIVPDNNVKKIDCPSVFRQHDKWYMTYLEFDGRGYQTWLAESDDLLSWKKLRVIMPFTDTTDWDTHQKAGYIALQDHTWGGSYTLESYHGKYYMSYFGGNTKGYEAGMLNIGIAYADDITKTTSMERLPKPVLSASDADVRWWENRKLFKSTIIWDKEKKTGYPFVMYYNANGDSSNNNPKYRWFERIGMAVSNDMKTWKRFHADPVLDHQGGITGDPYLQKMGDLWVMFYFGAFYGGRKDSYNRFACSYDLINWTDWEGDDLVKSSEEYDAKYAHKSFVVNYKGVVYHFYCAVNSKDQRGIAVATSKDLGKSSVHFVAN
jgi:predicted GH43/DUF377 family glycosyl hydrolase